MLARMHLSVLAAGIGDTVAKKPKGGKKSAGKKEEKSMQSLGGVARAKKLSSKQRSAIAKKAANARWGKSEEEEAIPEATFGSANRPLKIGDVSLQCYVLEDGRRVLTQGTLQQGIGMSRGGGSMGAQRISHFIERIESKSVDTNGLSVRSKSRIEFKIPGGGIAYGYEATLLPEICDAVLEARRVGVLNNQQAHIADRCELLMRGLARVGIIALVDEATGYQEARTHDALATILEAFIDNELSKWVRTFDPEFYKEMYRLWGWEYNAKSTKRTPHVGKLTNDLVYERLAPGVLEELRKMTPRNDKGKLKTHLHRLLTRKVGHPALREHLASIITMMQMSKTKEEFLESIDRLKPKFDTEV